MRRPGPILGVAAALALAGAEPALATYPGANGKVAWTSVLDAGLPEARPAIFVDTAPLITPPPGEHHFQPSWSADGSKLVFLSYSSFWGVQIERVNADGSGRQVVLNTTLLGLPQPDGPVWSPDGTRIRFRVPGGGAQLDRMGEVQADGTGFAIVEFHSVSSPVDWSAKNQVLYRFQGFGNKLSWYGNGQGGLLEITIPGESAPPSVFTPVWMPDGDTIVFGATWSTNHEGQMVTKSELFKIRRDGSGLKQLTHSRDICPAPGWTPEFGINAAAPSPDGDLIAFSGHRSRLVSYNGFTCTNTGSFGLFAIPAEGGPPRLIHDDPNSVGTRVSWQPKPASLVVKIDDGRDNPLEGLKLEIYDATAPPGNPPWNVVVENTIGGSYGIDLPFGSYRVRAILKESSRPGVSAFDVRHRNIPDETVWLEKTVIHQLGLPPARISFSPAATGASNFPAGARDNLDDIANIYFRMKQFVDWVRADLTPDTGAPVEVYTFATHRLDGTPIPPKYMSYNPGRKVITMGTESSEYGDRDGSATAMSPENGEWHEFSHHLVREFVSAEPCSGSSHGGYTNPDTCDSMNEGIAAFLPTLAAQTIEGASDADYDGIFGSIEENRVAWERSTKGTPREDLAVAALFWDLWDVEVDGQSSEVIGSDGAHHDVVYYDNVSLSLQDIWQRLTGLPPIEPTVALLRAAFGTAAPTRDLDGNFVFDVAPIDEVFLMHGFFPVIGDQQITPTHTSYHFDVDGGVGNDHVGRSDHDVLNADGSVADTTGVRLNVEPDPGAYIAVSALDASGTPLAGATVRLTLDDTEIPHTIERRIDTGLAAPVEIELPPYFSYLLPADDPTLPPCDPVNDRTVEVVVTARINGYDSADSFTFDNCTYWHAIAASAGAPALSFTMNFPEDSTPPVSTVYALASAAFNGNATLGYWTLELSCGDPVAGGFASGCRHTEYRINGGPLTTYGDTIELVENGQYLVEYRSLDAAANAEAFQSATYTVGTLAPDADADGLPDAEEIVRGTNPQDPDTDDDDLQDGAEVDLGTNPLVGDTDGDGLTDGDEVGRGTHPLDGDSDDDGLSDSVEVGLGTNPLLADTDGDGLSDPAEIAAGLNPLLADTDGDRHLDGADSCPTVSNPAQGDADGDGVGEMCDVCPGVSDAGQADADGDGAGDVCDCAVWDPLIRRPAEPTVAAAKTGGSTIVLTWPSVAGVDHYLVTVGTRAGLASGDYGACAGSSGGALTFQSSQVPAPGELLTYLVQGESLGCGMGSLGFRAGDVPRVNANTAACAPVAAVDRVSLSGTLVSGWVFGEHTASHVTDGFVVSLQERTSSGGSPANRYSVLDYRFTVDVAPAPQIQLLVKGLRSITSDGDDFRFEWSTNGTTWTPVAMPSLPIANQDDAKFRVGSLPPTLSGLITIRVVDTNHAPGTLSDDWMWVDALIVRSISP